MTSRLRWMAIAPAVVAAALALSGAPAEAADKSGVDQATARVERGAKAIGRGSLGPGFKDFFVGIGHTIVEGAKYSGENVKEFFSGKK